MTIGPQVHPEGPWELVPQSKLRARDHSHPKRDTRYPSVHSLLFSSSSSPLTFKIRYKCCNSYHKKREETDVGNITPLYSPNHTFRINVDQPLKSIFATIKKETKKSHKSKNSTITLTLKEKQEKSIFIKYIDGSSKILYLNLDQTTVHDLMLKIELITNIPKHELRYTFQGKELQSKGKATLDKLNIKKRYHH